MTGRKRKSSKAGRGKRSEKGKSMTDIDKSVSESVKKKPVGVTQTKRKPGTGFDSKSRMFEYKKAKSAQAIASAKQDANLQGKIHRGESVSIVPFLEQKKSGVYTPEELKKAASKITGKIPEKGFVQDVSKKGDGVTVKGDYRKMQYNVDPRASKMETGGWKLDIPESFKKVSDTKFKAPEKEFKKSEDYDYWRYEEGTRYDSERDRSKDDDESFGTYSPVEIRLSEDGDQLKKVIKRGDYTQKERSKSFEEEFEEEGDSYEDDYEEKYKTSEREKDRATYTKELQDYYGSGVMQQMKKYKPYTTRHEDYDYEKEREDDDEEWSLEKSDEFETKDIYQKFGIKYDPKGRTQRERAWDTKYDEVDEEELEEFNKEVEEKEYEKSPYKKRDIQYDKGLKTREQRWRPYTSYEREQEEDTWGRETEELDWEQKRRKHLDVKYEQGAPVSYEKYGDYVEEREKEEDGDELDITKDREPYLKQKRTYWEGKPGAIQQKIDYEPRMRSKGSQTEKDVTETVSLDQTPIDMSGKPDDYAIDRDENQILFYGDAGSEDVIERTTGPKQRQIYTPGGNLFVEEKFGQVGKAKTTQVPTGLSTEEAWDLRYGTDMTDSEKVGVQRSGGGWHFYEPGGSRGYDMYTGRAYDYGLKNRMFYDATGAARRTL